LSSTPDSSTSALRATSTRLGDQLGVPGTQRPRCHHDLDQGLDLLLELGDPESGLLVVRRQPLEPRADIVRPVVHRMSLPAQPAGCARLPAHDRPDRPDRQ
jgi:hypothetical protein